MSTYTIAFDLKGGGFREDATPDFGDWETVEAPTYAGHVFDGWIANGHDRATAVYSTDGGTTAVPMDAYPMPVPVAADGSVMVKDLAGAGGLVTLSAKWRTLFGGTNTGCPTIEMASFNPICAKDDVDDSKPLTLDVPVPVFAPAIPPPECACFDFAAGENAKVTVTMHAGNKQTAQGTASVAIKSVGDCCDGKYEVTPTITVDIPECVQDDSEHSEEVALGAGGTIKYTLKIVNCVPQLRIEQVTPVKQFDGAVPNFCLAPSSVVVKATSAMAQRLDPDAELRKFVEETYDITAGNGDGQYRDCLKYSFPTISLDLTDLDFNNGGSVFQSGTDGNLYTDGAEDDEADTWHGGGLGDRGDNNGEQYVERRGPAMRGGDSPWGQGVDYFIPRVTYLSNGVPTLKITTDKTQTATEWQSGRRPGPEAAEELAEAGIATGNLSMALPAGLQWHERGVALTLSHFLWNPSGLLSSMNETGVGALISPAPTIFANDAKRSTASGTRTVSGLNASGLHINPPSTPTSGNSWYGFEGGLDVYDGDGLRVFGSDYKTTAAEIGDTATAPDSRFGRLEVMYGPGFRIRAANNGTTPQYRNKPVDEDGALVPNEGRGLRVHGVTKMGNDSTDTDHKNKLEVFGHSGDFKFNYDGKMVINDEKTNSFYQVPWFDGNNFTRNGDYALTVGLNTLEPLETWVPENGGNSGFYMSTIPDTYAARLASIAHNAQEDVFKASVIRELAAIIEDVMIWIASWRVATVYLGKAGTVLAVNNTIAEDVQVPVADRHYQASAPSQNG